MKRINNGTLFWGKIKFTLGRPKIANFNSAKTFKITNSQTLISANISSFTVICITCPGQVMCRLVGAKIPRHTNDATSNTITSSMAFQDLSLRKLGITILISNSTHKPCFYHLCKSTLHPLV